MSMSILFNTTTKQSKTRNPQIRLRQWQTTSKKNGCKNQLLQSCGRSSFWFCSEVSSPPHRNAEPKTQATRHLPRQATQERGNPLPPSPLPAQDQRRPLFRSRFLTVRAERSSK